MIRVQGARLSAALQVGVGAELFVTAVPELRAAADPVPLIPVVLQIGHLRPGESENWQAFKDRVGDRLGEVVDQLYAEVGAEEVVPLYAANALATAMTVDQLAVVSAHPRITVDFADLDPLLPVVAMDEVVTDIGLHAFMATVKHTGAGVKVAVLD